MKSASVKKDAQKIPPALFEKERVGIYAVFLAQWKGGVAQHIKVGVIQKCQPVIPHFPWAFKPNEAGQAVMLGKCWSKTFGAAKNEVSRKIKSEMQYQRSRRKRW